VGSALDVWRDYMVNMDWDTGWGWTCPQKIGVYTEQQFYTNVYQTDRWNAHYIISIAIGQGRC